MSEDANEYRRDIQSKNIFLFSPIKFSIKILASLLNIVRTRIKEVH